MSTVRNTLNVVRYDWLGVRIGGPGASMRGLWPVLIVALLVVFGCFFAIGRLFAGGGSPLEGSSAAPVARAAIPSALHGGSPIAGEVPNSIAQPPPPRRAAPSRAAEAPPASASSQAFSGEALGPEASSATQPESAPAVQQSPAQAPEPSRASSGAGASGGKASAGGTSGGGGSFDSSE
jgi:uncharacterized membrane protein YgcG